MSERDNNNNGKTEHKKTEIQVYEIQGMSQREKRWDEQQKEYLNKIWEREKKASEFDMISANIKVLYCNRRANEIQLKLSAFQMFI